MSIMTNQKTRVYKRLINNDCTSGSFIFFFINRKIFRRGASDSFVMAVPRRLGRLNYCRIWHDNSGNGKFRSWFLSYVVVRDAQTGEKFEFICNKWLAVEKDDGSVDRLIPVAGRKFVIIAVRVNIKEAKIKEISEK